jgi:hypothetical protein
MQARANRPSGKLDFVLGNHYHRNRAQMGLIGGLGQSWIGSRP